MTLNYETTASENEATANSVVLSIMNTARLISSNTLLLRQVTKSEN